MSPFEQELRDCLGVVLGAPLPDDDAFRFFKQWLAERNLGLVPIANAGDFDWPGYWLARGPGLKGDRYFDGRGGDQIVFAD